MEKGARGREAQCSGGKGLVDHADHRGDVLGPAWRLVHPAFTHGRQADRAVPDHSTHVQTLGEPIQLVQVVAVGLPVPGQALQDARRRDVLDGLHHLGQGLAAPRCDRSERDAAVAEHHGGDTVPAGGAADRVPGQLGVQVGVDVDEAGGHDQPIGVDLAPCRALGAPDLDYAVTVDDHVGGPGRSAGAVDDGPTADYQIVRHAVLPWSTPVGTRPTVAAGPISRGTACSRRGRTTPRRDQPTEASGPLQRCPCRSSRPACPRREACRTE